LTDAELATGPASVEQPAVGLLLGHTFGKHARISTWMQNDKGLAKASREGRARLDHAVLGPRRLPAQAIDTPQLDVSAPKVLFGSLCGVQVDTHEV
jgi:hypothetical protein